ncbi:MAG: hypothetical protein ACRDFB_05075 [Rhabdochlamydiaceae bacterium]
MGIVRGAIAMYGNEFIDPIVIFQDPYSEVSLFLSRKIKEQSSSVDHSKKWSLYLQEKLLEKIAPEFGKKFPAYRLGAAALKKTWEKVSHLSQLFEKQSDALTASGKLNIHFLIRENLKIILDQKKNSSFHPFLLAQQLALKVGESLASYEGIRPPLQQLTELICTALHHLVPSHLLPQFSFAKKNLDVKDRLIAKWMIDALTSKPGIPYHELYQVIQDKLKLFKTFKEDLVPWVSELSMNWASVLLPFTIFFQTQSSETIRELKAWINKFMYDSSQNFEQQIQDIKTAALSLKQNISLYDLEVLSWSCLKETQPPTAPSSLYDELLHEAKSHLIHHPQEHWKTAIAHAAHFITKAIAISCIGNTAEWNHRIVLWSNQGELILRSLEFPETPLLHLVREMHLKNRSLADPSITTKLREQYLYRYQSPLIEPSCVHRVADLMRKYGWYHLASTHQDITFNRWIMLYSNRSLDKVSGFNDRQWVYISNTNPLTVVEPERRSRETDLEYLQTRAKKEFPLLPFPQDLDLYRM